MSYIGKTQLKKWFSEELKPFLKPHGFKIAPRFGISVIERETLTSLDYIYISVDSSDFLGTPPFACISYIQVEELLGKIVGLGHGNGSTTLKIFPSNSHQTFGKTIKNREDVKIVAGTFKRVFEQEYLPAFAQYHDPHQVLKLWDSLKTPFEKGQYFADSNNHSKILIISKLVNDQNFEERVKHSLAHYNTLIANGEEFFKEELSYCEKVIAYLRENQI